MVFLFCLSGFAGGCCGLFCGVRFRELHRNISSALTKSPEVQIAHIMILTESLIRICTAILVVANPTP